uniref:Uncharacterized protein n=1 Tax=Romanomermis culicivorax TaxID=13658 RepID=A0A915JQP1_ROMCU
MRILADNFCVLCFKILFKLSPAQYSKIRQKLGACKLTPNNWTIFLCDNSPKRRASRSTQSHFHTYKDERLKHAELHKNYTEDNDYFPSPEKIPSYSSIPEKIPGYFTIKRLTFYSNILIFPFSLMNATETTDSEQVLEFKIIKNDVLQAIIRGL